MHLKRWLTSIVILPFILFLIYKGGISFSILIGIVCLIALSEYFRLLFNPKSRTISGVLLLLGLIAGGLMLGAAYKNKPELILAIIAFHLIVSGFFSLTQFQSDPFILENITKQIQGVIYIPLSLSFLILIRNSAEGMTWIFFLICVIFAGDTGAYYVGTYFGKHKLCPSVSPGKTIEGSLGGLRQMWGSAFSSNAFSCPCHPGVSVFFFFSLLELPDR